MTPKSSLLDNARTLFAESARGVLATLSRDDGYPYASVVEFMPTAEGDIILLLSALAEHTQNLEADSRASLVIAEDSSDDAVLALGRATFKGRIERVDNGGEHYRETYLGHHPDAVNYVDFADFAFYRLTVERVRFIGGFGRMGWIERNQWLAELTS